MHTGMLCFPPTLWSLDVLQTGGGGEGGGLSCSPGTLSGSVHAYSGPLTGGPDVVS